MFTSGDRRFLCVHVFDLHVSEFRLEGGMFETE